MKRNALKAITVVPALALALWGGACGKGDNQANQAAADSAARNLTLLPTNSAAQMGDTAVAPATSPAAAPAPTAPAAAPVRRAPAPAPAKATPTRRAPAGPSSYTAAAGTKVKLAVNDAISSRSAQAGQEFTAKVTNDVTDAAGHVVIPAGSTVTGSVTEVKSGGANSAGTLTLAIASVTVRGTTYPVDATIESVTTVRQGRGVTGNDAVKVGAGAVVGAIAGRIIGKNTKGTVIGAVAGAAGGAGVAAATRTVDIVLPAGGEVDIALNKPVTVPVR